ncbi:MAG: ABC transporter ATP-binding protein, partial [Clostridia bacterium]|nr:ABC transporter ATP-binding protein [Clostridia bacterium]
MKKKNSKGELILTFLKGSKKFFILAILASLCVTVVDMVIPQLVRYTVDTLIGGEKSGLPEFANKIIDRIGGPEYLKDRLWIIAIAVACMALLSALFSFLQRTLDGKAAETLVERMRN